MTKTFTVGKRDKMQLDLDLLNKAPGDFKNGASQAITWSMLNWYSSKKMKSFTPALMGGYCLP